MRTVGSSDIPLNPNFSSIILPQSFSLLFRKIFYKGLEFLELVEYFSFCFQEIDPILM
jgi:hypothetical protein